MAHLYYWSLEKKDNTNWYLMSWQIRRKFSHL